MESESNIDISTQQSDYISETDNTSIYDNDSILTSLINNTKSEIVSSDKTYEKYYNKIKKTKIFITKFEKAKIIGVRAQMISSGIPPLVKVPKHITSTIDIAELEYKEKKIPLLIRRFLPNNEYEDWRLDELITN